MTILDQKQGIRVICALLAVGLSVLQTACQTPGVIDIKENTAGEIRNLAERGKTIQRIAAPYIPKVPFSDYAINYQCRGTTTARAFYRNTRVHGISGEPVGTLELNYLGKTYYFNRVIDKPLWQGYVATLNSTNSTTPQRLQWFVRGRAAGLRNLKDAPADQLVTRNLINECVQTGEAVEITPVRKSVEAVKKEVVINRNFEPPMLADQELKGPDTPVRLKTVEVVTKTSTGIKKLFGKTAEVSESRTVVVEEAAGAGTDNTPVIAGETRTVTSESSPAGQAWLKSVTSRIGRPKPATPSTDTGDEPARISKKVLDREILINVP